MKTSETKNKKVISRERKTKQRKILTESTPFAVKEAYVQLRTNLMFSVASETDGRGRVFMVTSANPSEGKSTTSSNIAVSFAMLGKKTLLIDCDMRKPNIHKLWGIPMTNGVSNLLTNIDVCCKNEIESLPLTVVSAGDVPPNPSELLSSSKFQRVIEKFRTSYDYVIIDTPPVNRVADARIIAKNTDGIVLVVKSGQTQINELNFAQQSFGEEAKKVCGFVLNSVNFKNGAYSYRQYGSKSYASYGE